jgi:hypothetical protein
MDGAASAVFRYNYMLGLSYMPWGTLRSDVSQHDTAKHSH